MTGLTGRLQRYDMVPYGSPVTTRWLSLNSDYRISFNRYMYLAPSA